MVDRRVPRIGDLAPLLKFRKPSLKFKQTRLAKAQTIYDLRRIARRRTPKAAFDYTEGAAEAEISLARARQAFEDIEFHPAILKDVSTVTTAWDVLGEWQKPFLCVFGKNDPILGGASKYLIEHVPGAKGQPHEQIWGGHFVQEDRGDELAKRLLAFVKA